MLVVLVLSTQAFAQSPQAKSMADALFDDGKNLVAAGKVAEGCAKFEASIEILPQLGTRLNLADCFEKIGRTASAWTEWREAAALASKAHDAREQFALDRMAALGPKVPRLTIDVAATTASLPGLVLKVDGQDVPKATFGTPLPVDPGAHTVDATAPGKPPFSQKVDVSASKTVTVDLSAAKPTAPVVVASKPSEGGGHGLRTVGLAVGIGGIAGLGAGMTMGMIARSSYRSAFSRGDCAGDVCNAAGQQTTSSAISLANAATVVTIIGGAALATGVVVYLVSPRRAPRVAAVPIVGGATGVALVGSW
jgi:hypothetical protein